MLGAQGCRIEACASAEDAHQALRDSTPDAVLLDVHLPGASGHSFLKELRANPLHSLLPVVMLTGSASRQDRLLAAAEGVSVYLVKPFDAEELSWRLSNLLRHKRVVDSLEDGGRVLVTLARTLEARDRYTAGHSERVANLSGRLGLEIGLSREDVLTLEQGGLVHDIGKVGIRDDLLLKAGPLTFEEREEFQRHPEIGLRMVENLRTMAHTLPVIHYHHERMNGLGYPGRLAGSEIPLLARITAFADVYDALSSPRPYRPAFEHETALAIIREETEKGLLDAEILGTFEQVVERDRAVVPREVIA
jgi:putative two-component system response regulator